MDLGHARLMDRTYRHQRLIYDVTRKYYLLGRDHLVAELNPPDGGTVLELACGTGRNLLRIRHRYPGCRLFGLDISAEMLRNARRTLGGDATLAFGDACTFDAEALLGRTRFDRIILSYSLSMIPDWRGALGHAVAHLAPGGELHIIDFGMQEGLPVWFQKVLHAWLARFHVTPRADLAAVVSALAHENGGTIRGRDLYRGYAKYLVLSC